MRIALLARLALMLALTSGLARAADAWTQLKLGMTTDQALAKLGEPLLRSTGQGFEIWTYDSRGELVFYGPLVGWTSPGVGETAGRTVDVWQAASDKDANARRVLPRPVPADKPLARRLADSDSSLPTYRRRS